MTKVIRSVGFLAVSFGILFVVLSCKDSAEYTDKPSNLVEPPIPPSQEWYSAGLALLKSRKNDEALAYFDKGVESNPDSPLVWFGKGSVLEALGQLDQARSCYDRALQLNPEYGLYGGGTGKTREDAVILDAPSSLAGISVENAYIQKMCGQRNKDWTMDSQKLLNRPDGKHYDLITIRLKDGTTRDFYFDISSFFGKP